jgi:hypothetical protein
VRRFTAEFFQHDRIRSEIVHLDVALFDPATDPGELPVLRKRVHRTEWFARGEQTNVVYNALRERGARWKPAPREAELI